MQKKLLTVYKEKTWSGGTSTEVDIFPSNASYEERNFIWRLSKATASGEESSFADLEDYNRWLMVEEGEAKLTIDNDRVETLKDYQCCQFSGGSKTLSQGEMKDYNLMVRNDSQGALTRLDIKGTKIGTSKTIKGDSTYYMEGYYISSGYGVVIVDGQKTLMEEGNQLVITCRRDEEYTVEIIGECTIIRSEVAFNKPENLKIKKEAKATKEDFLYALRVSLTSFRGAKRIFKGLQDEWQDKALREGIKKVETFFIPYIVFLLGIIIAAFVGMSASGTRGMVFAILAWAIVDMLVITPLIYLAFMPKPVNEHIKKYSEMTEMERAMALELTDENLRVERILKKYKITGRNKYTDN